MATYVPEPVVMVFKKDPQANYKEVRHYLLVDGPLFFNQKIHISKDRNFSKSKAAYWLRKRKGNRWGDCITGLLPTSSKLVFYGDTDRKKNLILFIFSESGEDLNIYLFPGFYTRHIEKFIKEFFVIVIQKGSA